MIATNVGDFGKEGMSPPPKGSIAFSGGTFFGGNIDDDAHFLFSDKTSLQDGPEMHCSGLVLHEKRVSNPNHGSLKISSKKASSRASSAVFSISFADFRRASRIRSTEIFWFLGVFTHSGSSCVKSERFQ